MSNSNTIFTLTIQSPSTHSQRQFPASTTISQLKARLEPITGIPASFQVFTGLSQNGSADLISAGLFDGAILNVESVDPGVSKELEQYLDVSQVDKYEMPLEEYESRPGTVLEFKKNMKLGRFSDKNPDSSTTESTSTSVPPDITIGQRCRLLNDNTQNVTAAERRGEIKFVGETSFASGIWIGVALDEPLGKNDGSVEGVEYFKVSPKCGVFVRPSGLETGDFPELDVFGSDDE